MEYLKNIIVLSVAIITNAVCFADENDNIYTWRSGNGTVVFSQTAPVFEEEYERVGVHHNNQVHQKSPVEQQLASLKQNNIYIADNSQSGNQSEKQQASNKVQKVQIISPAPGESRFVNNEKLSIILNPTLSAEDHPIFIMNGIPHPAHFENGVWKVNRPNPGPVSITVRGRTHDHKTITSNESDFYRRQVFNHS